VAADGRLGAVLGQRAGRLDLVRDGPRPRRPVPSLADVGYLAAPPLAAAALISLPFAAQSLVGRARQVLDGLMIAASLLLASWVMVLSPLFRSGGDDLLSQAISLAYPIGDVVVGTIVLFVLARARMGQGTRGTPLPLLGGGLVAIAVADSGFVYLTAVGSYSSGALIDAGWFLGYLLVLLAARKPESDGVNEEEAATSVDRMGLFLPYIAVVGAVAVSTIAQIQEGILDSFAAWCRSFIILALVGRQVLSLLENLSLARHLEARVVERTAELRASEQRFQALVQHSSEVVILVDADGRVVYVSESMARVFGYSEAHLLGRRLSQILDAEAGARLGEGLAEVAERPYGVLELELPLRHRDGHQCTVQLTITNLLDNPAVGGLVLNTRDISERRQLEDQLSHQAFHDNLTSLANRALFKDRVEHALNWTLRQTPSVAVLFLDLDGFKEVNDSLGHAAGDRLLIQVAERLQSCVRPSDTVARFGGDEFAVLIEDASDDLDVIQVAERVLEGLRQPFVVNGRELHVRGSMGIARMDPMPTGWISCCATPTWPCTGPRRPGGVASSATTPRCTASWCSGCSSRPTCAAPSRRASCSSSTSRPSIWARARSSGPRRWPAGATRSRGWSRRPSSSPWPRRAG